MGFEYDPAKSRANRQKHGLDFAEASALWDDPWRLDVPVRTEGEARIMTLAKLNDRIWAAIWTIRGENIRVISVRRARKDEVAYYENI